jgi:4-alpha-glucanotransferase
LCSAAALAIAPFQDLLNLGSEARMNLPGSAEANWCWRLTEDMLDTPVFQQLRDLTASSDRLPVSQTLPIAKIVKAAS